MKLIDEVVSRATAMLIPWDTGRKTYSVVELVFGRISKDQSFTINKKAIILFNG